MVELLASLMIPPTGWIGAALGIGVMVGAIIAHLTILGIEVQGDGGYLFFLALTVTGCCATILLLTRAQWVPVVQQVLVRKRPTLLW